MVLASYHEVWWILVLMQNKNDQYNTVPLMEFPFIVKNIAHKIGKVKCKFTAPGKPGQYKRAKHLFYLRVFNHKL